MFMSNISRNNTVHHSTIMDTYTRQYWLNQVKNNTKSETNRKQFFLNCIEHVWTNQFENIANSCAKEKKVFQSEMLRSLFDFLRTSAKYSVFILNSSFPFYFLFFLSFFSAISKRRFHYFYFSDCIFITHNLRLKVKSIQNFYK